MLTGIFCITVSTNYSDLLDLIIPKNYTFFDKWYILTDKNDNATIDVINKYNNHNIEILFYDFCTNSVCFDKGGAIRSCQEKLTSDNYCGKVLLLDSDIVLPTNFLEIMSSISVANDTIYGLNTRVDFYSYKAFMENNVDKNYELSYPCCGFFQLYFHSDNKYLYNHSYNCSECDLVFRDKFPNRILISATAKHLGKEYINWNGRINKNDFL